MLQKQPATAAQTDLRKALRNHFPVTTPQGIIKKLKIEPIQLQFYTKSDCPLCDDAKRVLQRIGAKTSFIAIEEIDITKDLGLFTKYKHLIPVLELDGQRLFVHHINRWKLIWQLQWYRFWRLFVKFAR